MNIIQTNFNYTKPLVPLNLNNVNYIVIHHPESIIASPEDIHEWHLQNGWSGFGYNEYIRKDGTVYIGRGNNIGAQCLSYNSVSYGICCEGNYHIETTMPEVQKQSLVERIKYNKARFPNFKFTAPHKQFCDTECPGINFPMAEILKRVEMVKVEDKPVIIDQEFKANLEILQSYNQINSPDYWLKHCFEGCMVDGLYVKDVLNKFAEYFKNRPL